MVKIAVIGVAGRMGKTIVSCITDTDGAKVSGGTERPGSPMIGKDVGEIAGIGKIKILAVGSLDDVIKKSDVVIDFSIPNSSMKTLHAAAKHGKAVVFGTTGFTEKQKKEIAKTAKDIRCVLAPNMSIGVNVLFKIASDTAKILGDAYDVEIVEAHHKFKKDAPSGTAVRLSEIIADSLGRDLKKVGVYGRKGMSEGRGPKEIGVHTLRAGDIVGEHRVMYGGMGETLELFHKAQSRETFARGAIRAAQWIVDQPSGLYDMQDVLGLNS
ncbi:MAG: 4-hydroxy-tetrahydrodipicolinate reductase [Nitrospinales bacterium]